MSCYLTGAIQNGQRKAATGWVVRMGLVLLLIGLTVFRGSNGQSLTSSTAAHLVEDHITPIIQLKRRLKATFALGIYAGWRSAFHH